MGGIRKPKKKYVAPGHPWQKTRLAEELIYVGEYGLRNKRELWKHRTQLTHFRGTARDLVALSIEERGVRENQLLGRLNRLALIDKNSQLDDILNLTIRDILERRLQTQVLRQGLAKTMHHARQLIVHGHIVLDQRRVTSPGMLLYREQEKAIKYAPNSPYTNSIHPELPKGETVTPAPEPREPAPKDKIEVKIPKVREIKEVELEEEVDKDEEIPEEEASADTGKEPVKEQKGEAKEKDAK
jgi:small subunit ribosomal protein S4